MLGSRLRHRYSWLAATVSLVSITLFFWSSHSNFLDFRTRLSGSNSAWIDRGPEAEDKAVILAKIQTEDVSWVLNELPDWQKAIYYMDDPANGTLHPPKNKGREAMAYLTFLIDHYDNLPSSMVFVHPHLESWPAAWHTDADGYNNLKSIQSLRLDYLQEQGYVNMRCLHNPGCPDEIQVLRNEEDRTAEHAMREAWPYMFGGNKSNIPETIAQPCCSQFAVSKTQVLKRNKEEYKRYRQWLFDTKFDDATSGRVFEYLWHVIFGRDAVYCPSLRECWCEQFGRC
ncbi:uncharacterized protein Z520_05290 [Fonsecaea multimorphosa CBS 102226]|uniref:DUF3431 domain-containing protein n=1 Tax=Fonsecaea multimorphosa CBS 102226 TaxID=1442371 RepID=A0A0D2K6Q4_9EURO|nr:uncharacterized protein Z520_05290 [Fonsecaea multimorphosa CBS 102226]KIX98829.1 hypothetical protein Z520_05290 [Fonsecaea multimorphosa CBS 102226]OAL25109.1 hypothetical protein AYO22_04986 [Fonsecaea multimorphosa]